MALQVKLLTPLGDEFLLTGSPASSPVMSPYGALTELRAAVSRSDLPVPSRGGVLPGREAYGAIQAELEFYMQCDTGEELERVYARLRQGWSRATPDSPCVLEIVGDHPLSPLYVDLVVDGVLPGVPVDMSKRTAETLTVPVVGVAGLARTGTLAGEGTVDATNAGVVPVWPTIRYEGAGGRVVAPSGATYSLPASEGVAVVDTDPLVLRAEGVLPECVPPGETGRWVLPAGARLEWVLRVADPWA